MRRRTPFCVGYCLTRTVSSAPALSRLTPQLAPANQSALLRRIHPNIAHWPQDGTREIAAKPGWPDRHRRCGLPATSFGDCHCRPPTAYPVRLPFSFFDRSGSGLMSNLGIPGAFTS